MSLEIYTIYDHPKDFPNLFVIRRCVVEKNGQIVHDQSAAVAPTLEEIRQHIPKNKVCIPRQPDDDPVIVECWL